MRVAKQICHIWGGPMVETTRLTYNLILPGGQAATALLRDIPVLFCCIFASITKEMRVI